MRAFIFLFNFLFPFVVFAGSAGVVLSSGEKMNLAAGWSTVDSHLLEKKIKVIQFQKSSLLGKFDTEFLPKNSKIAAQDFLNNKCEETKKFFMRSSKNIKMEILKMGCVISWSEGAKEQRINIRWAKGSTANVAVLDILNLTWKSKESNLGKPVADLEKNFFRGGL